MDRDKKITLSLFLTWVVFGLFNLFGQPQAFVPPIIVDGLIIGGLGLYFCFPIQKNHFYHALIAFTVFIFLLSAIELRYLEINLFTTVVAAGVNILFLTYFVFGTLHTYQEDKIVSRLSLIIIIFHTISVFTALTDFLPALVYFPPILVYCISGICSAMALFLIKDQPEYNQTLKRIYLVMTLNFVFDIGNFLALLQFTAL